MEALGHSRKATDGDRNNDAFMIGNRPSQSLAVADGGIDSYGVASKTLILLMRLLRHTDSAELQRFPTWQRIFETIDQQLVGGPECSLMAGVMIGRGIYGAVAGPEIKCLKVRSDSYLDSMTDYSRQRLGSGSPAIKPLYGEIPLDEFIIMTNAWENIDRISVQGARRNHFSEYPKFFINQGCSRGYCPSDMTVIVARR